MPLSLLQMKRLMCANEELASAPKPCFGVNIFDIQTENLPKFFELGEKFTVEGGALQKLLNWKLSHFSTRDCGQGVTRVVVLFHYPTEFDLEAFMAIANNDPSFAQDYAEWCQTMSSYDWFITSETPVPEAWAPKSIK